MWIKYEFIMMSAVNSSHIYLSEPSFMACKISKISPWSQKVPNGFSLPLSFFPPAHRKTASSLTQSNQLPSSSHIKSFVILGYTLMDSSLLLYYISWCFFWVSFLFLSSSFFVFMLISYPPIQDFGRTCFNILSTTLSDLKGIQRHLLNLINFP